MKNIIAFAASIALNLVVLGSVNSDLFRTQVAPEGEVTVEQLPAPELVAAADAASNGSALL